MLHPDTELKFINDNVGHGIFATADIPKGTIVYVKDKLDIELSRIAYDAMDEKHKKLVDKFAYIDENGKRIIAWDNAKYVNHRCDCNTISTGYGFEIAIKDILKGEEITDEYGLFNLPYSMALNCNCRNCRKVIFTTDIEKYADKWDQLIIEAMKLMNVVAQPLIDFMDFETKKEIKHYFSGLNDYHSVKNLKYFRNTTKNKKSI